MKTEMLKITLCSGCASKFDSEPNGLNNIVGSVVTNLSLGGASFGSCCACQSVNCDIREADIVYHKMVDLSLPGISYHMVEMACDGKPFRMELDHNDWFEVCHLLNCGVSGEDSHGEIISAEFFNKEICGYVKKVVLVTPESLPVLVRRLINGRPRAVDLAAGIVCELKLVTEDF